MQASYLICNISLNRTLPIFINNTCVLDSKYHLKILAQKIALKCHISKLSVGNPLFFFETVCPKLLKQSQLNNQHGVYF